jgi:hypothetical protein
MYLSAINIEPTSNYEGVTQQKQIHVHVEQLSTWTKIAVFTAVIGTLISIYKLSEGK